MKFESEGRELAKFLRSLEQFIQTVKGQNNFWQQNAFLTCSWRFLISYRLERLYIIQIGKIYWDLETCRKSWKNIDYVGPRETTIVFFMF